MKETILKQIHGIGKAGNIIARICQVFLVIAFIGVLIGLVAVLILPNNFVKVDVGGTVDVTVDLSEYATLSEADQADARQGLESAMREDPDDVTLLDYSVTATTIRLLLGTSDQSFRVHDLIGPLLVALLYLVACYVALLFLGKLFRAFRDCSAPFDDPIVRSMKNFAFSLIPWVVLTMISDSVLTSALRSTFSFKIDFNLETVLFVLMVFVLWGVFRYGAELQREHNGTAQMGIDDLI